MTPDYVPLTDAEKARALAIAWAMIDAQDANDRLNAILDSDADEGFLESLARARAKLAAIYDRDWKLK